MTEEKKHDVDFAQADGNFHFCHCQWTQKWCSVDV